MKGEKPEDLQHFKSAPELLPPKVKVNVADPNLEGDIFTDPLPAPAIHVGNKLLEFEPPGPNGLMILNPEGKLLWWQQFDEEAGSNLEEVTYEGKTDLAWWQGKVTTAAFGLGEGVIANSAYEPVAHIKAGNGQHADIHELYITPEGQAWIDAYELVCLPENPECNPVVVDGVAQEIDIKTGPRDVGMARPERNPDERKRSAGHRTGTRNRKREAGLRPLPPQLDPAAAGRSRAALAARHLRRLRRGTAHREDHLADRRQEDVPVQTSQGIRRRDCSKEEKKVACEQGSTSSTTRAWAARS